jgi:nicotinamidase-related amidase
MLDKIMGTDAFHRYPFCFLDIVTGGSQLMGNKAVIVVDMLRDFVSGELANPKSEQITPKISALLDEAHRKGWLVIYGNDAHLPGDPEERVWGRHALAGTPGAEVIPDLAPADSDVVLPKRFYSAFYETGLDSLLRQNDIDEVIITGQHTNICVRHTASDAFNAGYAVIVPRDAVAMFEEQGMSEDQYHALQEGALGYLKKVYGARVTTVDEILQEERSLSKA